MTGFDSADRISVFIVSEDLANQIRWSTEYKKEICARGLTAGRFLSVPAAEFLSGLPLGWTSAVPGAVDAKQLKLEAR